MSKQVNTFSEAMALLREQGMNKDPVKAALNKCTNPTLAAMIVEYDSALPSLGLPNAILGLDLKPILKPNKVNYLSWLSARLDQFVEKQHLSTYQLAFGGKLLPGLPAPGDLRAAAANLPLPPAAANAELVATIAKRKETELLTFNDLISLGRFDLCLTHKFAGKEVPFHLSPLVVAGMSMAQELSDLKAKNLLAPGGLARPPTSPAAAAAARSRSRSRVGHRHGAKSKCWPVGFV